MFSNALETFLVRYGRFFGESYPQRWHFRAGPLFPGVPQLENVISEGMIHQKIVRSARGMSLEHSKTCGTCSAGVTYSVVNRVWQNAWYWRRYLLLNPHKVEILEILTLICGGTPPPDGRCTERRENFKQVLKYGEYEVPKKKVEREGFIEIAHWFVSFYMSITCSQTLTLVLSPWLRFKIILKAWKW